MTEAKKPAEIIEIVTEDHYGLAVLALIVGVVVTIGVVYVLSQREVSE